MGAPSVENESMKVRLGLTVLAYGVVNPGLEDGASRFHSASVSIVGFGLVYLYAALGMVMMTGIMAVVEMGLSLEPVSFVEAG